MSGSMEYRLKFAGAVVIDQPLNIKEDYSIALKRCEIRSVTHTLNTDDPEGCYTYSLESLDLVTIIGAGNKIISGKGKSRSKQMRARLYQIAQERGIENCEAFYQQQMNKIISRLDELI